MKPHMPTLIRALAKGHDLVRAHRAACVETSFAVHPGPAGEASITVEGRPLRFALAALPEGLRRRLSAQVGRMMHLDAVDLAAIRRIAR